MEWLRWLGDQLVQRLTPAQVSVVEPPVYTVLAHASPALLLVLQALRAYSVPVERVYLTFEPTSEFLARVRDLCTDGVWVDTTLGDIMGIRPLYDAFDARHPDHTTYILVLCDDFEDDDSEKTTHLAQDQLTFGADLYTRGCVAQLYEWTLEQMMRRGRAFSERFPKALPLDLQETPQAQGYDDLVRVYLDATRGASDELIPVSMIVTYLEQTDAITDHEQSMVGILRTIHDFQRSTD
jgi:hypothetical protein